MLASVRKTGRLLVVHEARHDRARGAVRTGEQLLERSAQDVRDPERHVGQGIGDRIGDERREKAVEIRFIAIEHRRKE